MDVELSETYAKHAEELVRFATVLVGPAGADDLVSLVWLRLAAGTDWARIENRRAFLFRSVVNAACDQHRSTERRRRRDAWAVLAPTEPDSAWIRPAVREAMRQLSVRQRAVVYLYYWFDLETDEVADQLHLSKRSVQRELERARRIMEDILR